MNPRARRENVSAQQVDGELVVYDAEHQRAHYLNRTAAVVWSHCDGNNDVATLAAILAREVAEEADENLVMMTLDQLAAGHLLEDAPRRSPEEARLSRRQFVRKVGVVGALALALPVVRSIAAPTPAAAQTCECCECCECCFCCGS